MTDWRSVEADHGFDPTNHHNAALCPHCSPPSVVVLERSKLEALVRGAFHDGAASLEGEGFDVSPSFDALATVETDARKLLAEQGRWEVKRKHPGYMYVLTPSLDDDAWDAAVRMLLDTAQKIVNHDPVDDDPTSMAENALIWLEGLLARAAAPKLLRDQLPIPESP